MGTKTRRGFLVATIFCGFATFLAGCGGGTPDNTIYQGAYGGGEWIVLGTPNPARYIATKDQETNSGRTLSFTVDQKGRLIGSFVAVDGTVYSVQGEIDNSGKFDATLSADGIDYRVKGNLSRQQVQQTDVADPTKDVFASGLAGDFVQTINGDEFNGSFFASGGLVTQ